MNFNQIL